MLLIVGLGNYPDKYRMTRHNFGFLAVDFLAERYGFSPWRQDKKFFGAVATGTFEGHKAILLKPHTLMNLSGKSVQAVKHFYDLAAHQVWVFSDDLDLDFGQTRFREKGSSGGQKGLADIIGCIGTSDFPRLKWGIGSDRKSVMPTERFVLSKFSESEQSELPHILDAGLKKMIPHLPEYS